MRKRRRLSPDEIAPYVLEISAARPNGPSSVGEGLPRIDWRALFGNEHPVEVEVGFGKGLFLVSAGMSAPERNFFGVEIVRKYQLYATTRVALRKLRNVVTCCADAKQLLHHVIPEASVAVVHVYFPDPWWKNRHKKRLLFTPDFAESVARVLRPGGRLKFVSDVADYFTMVTDTLAGIPGFRRQADPDPNEPRHDMDYLTNFERKFRKEGRPIYRSEYEKI